MVLYVPAVVSSGPNLTGDAYPPRRKDEVTHGAETSGERRSLSFRLGRTESEGGGGSDLGPQDTTLVKSGVTGKGTGD